MLTINSGIYNNNNYKTSFKSLVPPLWQNELNSIYYKRSLAKRNAAIDFALKRKVVKFRQFKQKISNLFCKVNTFIPEIKIKY